MGDVLASTLVDDVQVARERRRAVELPSDAADHDEPDPMSRERPQQPAEVELRRKIPRHSALPTRRCEETKRSHTLFRMSETLRWREPQVLPEERAIFSYAAMAHEVQVVAARAGEPVERLEARILRAALDRGDRRLRHVRSLCESALCQASPGSSRAEQFAGAHGDNDSTITPGAAP